MFDIAVIGGGIIGAALARELSRYELSLGLFEKNEDVADEVSKANSGIIHGGFDDPPGSLKARYSQDGARLFKAWDRELHFGYEEIGSLVLAFSPEDSRTLRHLRSRGEERGIRGLEIWSRDRVRAEEPRISGRVSEALFSAFSGVVSPYEVVIALTENAAENGLRIFPNTEIKDLKKENRRFRLVTEKKDYFASLVLNCAGAESAAISAHLREDVPPLRFRKGEYLLFDRDTGAEIRHVLFPCPGPLGKGILVTPTYHNNLLIGPDARDHVGSGDTGTDLPSLEKILRSARKVYPSLPADKMIKSYAGVRSLSRDKDFIVREDPEGFIELGGIASPGLTSAPGIARDVIERLIAKHFSLREKTNFQAEREPHIPGNRRKVFLPLPEAAARARLPFSDPRCLICRCEQITRAECLRSLRKSPFPLSTTDALKKRLRTGQGRCQGAFCFPRVRSLMAEFYGKPEEFFTQSGRKKRPARVDQKEYRKKIVSPFSETS